MIELIAGGLLRLAPEVLGYFDRKDRRKHELAIADRGLEQETIKAIGTVSKDAAKVEYKPTGYKWLDAMLATVSVASAAVRPAVTYLVVAFYIAYKIALWQQLEAVAWTENMITFYTPFDSSVLGTILGFWFVSREIAKK